MKNQKGNAVVFIVVLILIVAPFVWVYNRAGWWGVIPAVICTILFLGWLINKISSPSKKEREEIENHIRRIFEGTYSFKDKKSIQKSLPSDYKAPFGSAVQVYDCIRLSLTSKKRDIAEQRFQDIDFFFGNFLEYKHLFTSDLIEFIQFQVDDAKHMFANTLFINLATQHYEKAQTLKTVKSKTKYAQMALDVLDEGIAHPETDEQMLRGHKVQIEEYIQSL
ncbi:hypothetical protein KW506_03530 [Vibrio fluvialis]|nr:hypothetical protein [Vibrio fluvialis]